MAYRLLASASKYQTPTSPAKVACVFVLLSTLSVLGQDKPDEAWWLRANFVPTETVYDSLPVSAINKDWVRITILSYASLPSEAKEDLDWMHRDGFRFVVDDYFKRAGLSDRELCGVFEDRAGHRGRFVLVLEKPTGGAWRVAYLHKEVGESGFSILIRRSEGLFWGTCMQCEEFSRLRIEHGAFHLVTAP